jgi:hypothetical protein
MTVEKHAPRTTTFEAIRALPLGRIIAIEDIHLITYSQLRLSDAEFKEVIVANGGQAEKPEE